MPGSASRPSSFQSTLRCAMWLMPETQVVKVSTVWTPADAAAGATPRLIRSVLEITPNAMPSAPSTICAAMPTAMKGSRSAKLNPPIARPLDFDDHILLAEQRRQNELSDVIDRLSERRPPFIAAVVGMAVEDR